MHDLADILDVNSKKLAIKLADLGIKSAQDALWHLPLRYQDRTKITAIADLRGGKEALIEGKIIESRMISSSKSFLSLTVQDHSGFIKITLFNLYPNQLRVYEHGKIMRCYGQVRSDNYGIAMTNPDCTFITKSEPLSLHLDAIYPTTTGIKREQMRQIIHKIVDNYAADLCTSLLPQEIRGNWSLLDAIRYVHKPPADADKWQLAQMQHPAQIRIIFEELLAHQLAYSEVRNYIHQSSAPNIIADDKLINRFMDNLGFQLTNAQKRVTAEIMQDLAQNLPMLRLVQGDVGSGKTVVAALAALEAISAGYQVVLMAPTDILAEQHYITFSNWFKPLDLEVVALRGKMRTAERRESLQQIASSAQMIIGTHALFQEKVQFNKLALVIIDEQHRFGVQQRMQLRDKGQNPHQLIMTATPIPRTLTMSVYADLDSSIIDELPPNRTPVTTSVINNQKRDAIIERVHIACKENKQVYWVCGLIEESEKINCEAATATYEHLVQQMSDIKIALLHGRMKPSEKKDIMQSFKDGKFNLLVATTVIEVGVDVPNASLMIIENAERLGLSQLHQLRGRVGRGSTVSHCVLMYQEPLAEMSRERLEIMRSTNDGFVIAEHDLQMRGPGEVLGTKQAGNAIFKVANLMRDAAYLEQAHQVAQDVRRQYPHLVQPLLNRWLDKANQYVSA